MPIYKVPINVHVVINRDRLEEAITDALFDNRKYETYEAAAEQAERLIQNVLDEDAAQLLADLVA